MKNNYEMFKVEIKKGKRADTIDSKFEFNHVYENLAKVDSLYHYFKNNFVDANNVHNIEFLNKSKIEEDKSWIDWDCVSEISPRREHYLKYVISDNAEKKNKKHSFYPPYRCNRCKKAWSKFITPSGAVKSSKYLPDDVFNSIRIEHKDCGKCNA